MNEKNYAKGIDAALEALVEEGYSEQFENPIEDLPEVEPKVEEIPEEIVEEEVIEEIPVQEEFVEPIKVEELKIPNAIDYLLDIWKDEEISRDILEDPQYAGVVSTVEGLLKERTELQNKVNGYEEHPAIKQSQYVEQIKDIYQENIEDWESELVEALGDDVNKLKKLGKKKSQELINYIGDEAAGYMLGKLKNNKKISNPLLFIQNKVRTKIDELSGVQEVKKEIPQVPQIKQPVNREPQIDERKKLASLTGDNTQVNNEKRYMTDPKMSNTSKVSLDHFYSDMNDPDLGLGDLMF